MHTAIQFQAVLSRVGTRSDGSLGLTLETPSLVPEDKLAVFNLQNIPCLVTFQPNDSDATPPREVKGEISKRTISERIRACIFVFWKQAGEPGTFEMFYQIEGEKLVAQLKAKLKPV
jgi:hypothetical protein